MSTKIYMEVLANQICSRLDDISLFVHRGKTDISAIGNLKYNIKNMIIMNAGPKIFIDQKPAYAVEDIDKNINTFLSSSIPLLTELSILKNQVKASGNSPERPELDFLAQVCVFPLKRKTLFMVFGEIFTKLWDDIMKTETAFVEKYFIQEYSYWNNADHPESISDDSWNKRKENWEMALPSSIPSVDGICMDLISIEELQNGAINNRYKMKFPTIEERSEKIAKGKAFDWYVKEKVKEMPAGFVPYCNLPEYLSWEIEFQKKFKEEDKIIKEKYEDAFAKIKDILVDFSTKMFDKKYSELIDLSGIDFNA